jgi:hypothetical protein
MQRRLENNSAATMIDLPAAIRISCDAVQNMRDVRSAEWTPDSLPVLKSEGRIKSPMVGMQLEL